MYYIFLGKAVQVLYADKTRRSVLCYFKDLSSFIYKKTILLK